MKVYQIISEDYDNLALLNPSGGNTDAETPASTPNAGGAIDKAADTAKQVSNTVSGFLPDWFGIDFTTLALTGLTVAAVAKLSNAGLSSVSSKYAAKLRLYDRVEARWTAKFATPLVTIFKWLGIATAISQLYSNLCVLEAMYVKGLIDETRLQSQREFEFGVFQTQILVPLVPKAVKWFINLTTGAKAVARLLGGLSAGATAGASVIALIATEAGIRWFQAWLGTESGRSWIANSILMYPIKMFGKIGDEAWDQLMNAYQAVTGKAPNKAVPGSYKQQAVQKYGDEKQATAALAARDAKKKDNAGYVNGIKVTDQSGNLLSNNELAFDATLNVFRQKALDAGKPDPLAQFAKPGQALPPIN